MPRGRVEKGQWAPLAYLTPRASYPVRSPLPAHSCFCTRRKPGCTRPPRKAAAAPAPPLRRECWRIGGGARAEHQASSAQMPWARGAAQAATAGRSSTAEATSVAPLNFEDPQVWLQAGLPISTPALGRAEVCISQKPAAQRGQKLQRGGAEGRQPPPNGEPPRPQPHPTGGSSPATRGRASVPWTHCHLPGGVAFTLL